jgi:hypothetical protein
VFAQPIGVLNPMNLTMPAPCPVEVFGSGQTWQARELVTIRRQVYDKLSRFSSAADGQAKVQAAFAEQLRPWQMWGILPAVAGMSTTTEKMLEPDEIQVMPDGKVMWKEAEDYTHIIHAPTLPAGERIPSAACGAKVPAKMFVSTHANVEPTCKGCAQVWKEHYQENKA